MNVISKFLKKKRRKKERAAKKVARKAKNNRAMHTKAEIEKIVASRDPLMVEVGSGKKAGSNGWVTVDLNPVCDIRWDLRNGLPFADNSVDKIYSSHFMEHLSFREGQAFMKDSLRVLKEGGEFSVCVPNARIFIEAYMSPEKEMEEFFQYRPAYNETSSIDRLNYMAYMDGHHKYMFDQENLVAVIRKAGFDAVEERGFQSDIDLKERDHESIYARAFKGSKA